MKRLIITTLVFMLGAPLSSYAESYKYEPSSFTIKGKLLSALGETPDGLKVNFPAIQLVKPITVQGNQDSPTEKGVILMHMVLNPKMMKAFKRLKGQAVFVTGTMFHSDNGNHQTNVLITPSYITQRGRSD